MKRNVYLTLMLVGLLCGSGFTLHDWRSDRFF